MTYEEMVTGVLDWVAETIPALAEVYDHETDTRTGDFPDAMVRVRQITHADSPESARGAGLQQIEQARFKLWSLDVTFVVDGALASEEASDDLGEFHDSLAAALEADDTLGGRVGGLAREWTFDFHPDAPFVEFGGGDRGRRMTLSFVVVGLIQQT